MAYATTKDAIDLYGALYALSAVTRDASANKNSLDKALEDASSEIDSYLAVLYTVPVSPVTGIMQRFCIDIAIYVASSNAGSVTEEKRKRYEDAIAWLRMVAAGKIEIPSTTPPEPSAGANNAMPEITGPCRIFSRAKMDGLL